MIKKGLAVAVILLFVGACIIPSVASKTVEQPSMPVSNGNTIYVDDDNINGPWDGTLEHPFKRIEDGIDASIDGNIVYVFNGRYEEGFLEIEKSIKIIGEDRENTIIDCNSHSEIFHLRGIGIKISGFTIKNARTPFGRCAGICIWRSNNNIISNNIIEHNEGVGIYIVSSSNNKIINNIIRYNDGRGIYIQSSSVPMEPSSYNLFYRNHIKNNGLGILLYGFDSGRKTARGLNFFIRNNFIDNNGDDAYFHNSYHNFWINNYWWDLYTTPFPINGERTYSRPPLFETKTKYVTRYDWFPASEPHDIGV